MTTIQTSVHPLYNKMKEHPLFKEYSTTFVNHIKDAVSQKNYFNINVIIKLIKTLETKISKDMNISEKTLRNIMFEYLINEASFKLKIDYIKSIQDIYENKPVSKYFYDVLSKIFILDGDKLNNCGVNLFFMKYKGIKEKNKHKIKDRDLLCHFIVPRLYTDKIKENKSVIFLISNGYLKVIKDYVFITQKTQAVLSKIKYKGSYYIYEYEDIVPYLTENQSLATTSSLIV